MNVKNPCAHNLKAAGSNPAPATTLPLQPVSCLKNLKDNVEAVSELAAIFVELGKQIQRVGFLLNPSGSQLSRSDSIRLIDVANEFLEAKAPNVRETYLVQLHHTMTLFTDGRWERPIASISAREIEEWATGRAWSPATRRSKLTDIRTLFSFAVKRDYVKKSPALAIDLPALDDGPPCVHDVDQVEKVLRAAQSMDRDLCRLLAVQYFAGLRPMAEAWLLEERNLHAGHVEVEGAKCKTRKRRLVPIQPALAAFLKLGGELPVKNLVRRWRAVRSAAGVDWGHDVTRHTFCSYRLASIEDAAKVAYEAGHDQQILFGKYRSIRTVNGQLITKDYAAGFWAIRPV